MDTTPTSQADGRLSQNPLRIRWFSLAQDLLASL
jgi:hypothetical protein